MKVSAIVVKVSLEDEDTNTIASASCIVEGNIHSVKPSDITDACQRAVAHCVDELESNFPTQKR